MNVSGAMLVKSDDSELIKNEIKYGTLTYPHLYISAAKLISDGSNQGLTGCQSKEYGEGAHASKLYPKGIFNFKNPPVLDDSDKPPYQKMVDQLVELGWPLMIHANGDQAIAYTLQVLPEQTESKKLLHRIEHCSILPQNIEDVFLKMKKSNIQPSFLIGHVGYWGYAFDQVIFKDVCFNNGVKFIDHLDLCKSMLHQHIPFTLHSDYPVTPLGALRMMEQAVTRVTEAAPDIKEITAGLNEIEDEDINIAKIENILKIEGIIKSKYENVLSDNTLNKNECVTSEEALAAVTYQAAKQCGLGKGIGTLEENCSANYVILEQNPILMDTPSKAFMRMRKISVLETWKDGIKIYPPQGSDLEYV
ncbi:MAG: amidohydrolase family protein [Flavobacteriaceae bacterium]|nr:amidohydrolase family protein [Flavobacteriaceae bacterium]